MSKLSYPAIIVFDAEDNIATTLDEFYRYAIEHKLDVALPHSSGSPIIITFKIPKKYTLFSCND